MAATAGAGVSAGASSDAAAIAYIKVDREGTRIYLMRSDGSGARRLTRWKSKRTAGEGGPVWSPDGRRLAFNSQGLYLVNADGTGLRRLTTGYDAAWSPRGSRITFARYIESTEDTEIYVINADGTGERFVAKGTMDLIHSGPAAGWSLDGRLLVFDADIAPFEPAIHVVRPDGTGMRRLIPQSNTDGSVREKYPVWSPNGRSVAFVRNDDIYVVRLDGTRLRRLTRGGISGGPTWSPDGRRIAYIRTASHRPRVYVINADGTGNRRLTGALDRDNKGENWGFHPRWRP